MKASLIIAVYKNIPFLKAILESLRFQTEKDFEIIIAEDGESEEVKNFVSEYPFEQPYQHLTQEDRGWQKNKAMNMAIRAAKADWLIFIDGDCILHHRFIEMHLRYASEKSILAGKRVKLEDAQSQPIINGSSTIQSLQGLLLRKMIAGKGDIKFIEEGIFISPSGIFGFIPKMRTNNKLVGSNMSFSKKAIEAINGFDEDYTLPAVGEDYDLTWRFIAAGYEHKSVRNLAVQYHLYHVENWTDQSHNMKICTQKQLENNYFCKNGLQKM
jgi:GT2 family glycosyltransferase